MVIPVTIIETERGELSQRALDRCLRAAYLAMAEEWVAKYLKLHFKSGNASRYGYKPRSAKWLKRKAFFGRIGLSLYGGQVPLVDRGRMRDMILGGYTIRAYPTRATVKLPGPRYLQARPNPIGPRRNRPDMAAEILRVLPDELKQLETYAGSRMDQLLNIERAKAALRKRKIGPAGVT